MCIGYRLPTSLLFVMILSQRLAARNPLLRVSRAQEAQNLKIRQQRCVWRYKQGTTTTTPGLRCTVLYCTSSLTLLQRLACSRQFCPLTRSLLPFLARSMQRMRYVRRASPCTVLYGVCTLLYYCSVLYTYIRTYAHTHTQPALYSSLVRS